MNVTEYPIEFQALRKGTWIEVEELERALGITAADGAKWNFALLRLRDQIREQTAILSRVDHDRLRLMDDAEANEYTFRGQVLSVDRQERRAADRALIDRTKLSESQRLLAEKYDRICFSVALAARVALRKQRVIEGLVRRPQLEAGEVEDELESEK